MNLQTVTGLIPVEDLGLIDGHGHVWIAPPDRVRPEARLPLCDHAAIVAELKSFRAVGGKRLWITSQEGVGAMGACYAGWRRLRGRQGRLCSFIPSAATMSKPCSYSSASGACPQTGCISATWISVLTPV